MILRKRWGLTRAEFYFDEEPVGVEADTIRCFQSPVRRPGFRCAPFHTRIIDLRRSSYEIEREIDRDTRQNVRRAELKDGLLYTCCSPDRQLLDEVFALQDEFAAQKRLPATDRRQMLELAKAGVLDVTFVRDPAGKPLVWRTYYRASRRIRWWQGGSLFRGLASSGQRQLYGRANRLAGFKDIFRAQELGLAEFDLGGWYVGTEDHQKLSINRFKQQFGGVVVEEFHCVRGATLRGKLALHLAEARTSWLARQRERAEGKSRAKATELHTNEGSAA
jgi:hypothetical protein